MVTVTVSTDFMPLPAVITNWPQRSAECEPPLSLYCACCSTGHTKCRLEAMLLGTVTTMVPSNQELMPKATVALGPPPIGPTNAADDRVLQIALPAVGVVH